MTNEDLIFFGLTASCGLLAIACTILKYRIDEHDEKLIFILKKLKKGDKNDCD